MEDIKRMRPNDIVTNDDWNLFIKQYTREMNKCTSVEEETEVATKYGFYTITQTAPLKTDLQHK